MKKIFYWIHWLYQWVLDWAKHRYALRALAILTFAEASVFLIPIDPLLLAMGFAKPKKGLFYAAVATVCSFLGALGGFAIGYYLWQSVSPFFFDFVFSEDKFNGVIAQFQEMTFISIFVAGFSPIPFKIFTISAGVANAPLMPFMAATLLSRGLRYGILGGLVYIWGQEIKGWIDNHFEKVTIAVSILLILAVVLVKFLF